VFVPKSATLTPRCSRIFPERFFQLVTGMIRTDRHRRRLAPGQAARRTIALIDEPQDRYDALLDLVAAIQVNFIRTPMGSLMSFSNVSSVSSIRAARNVFSATWDTAQTV